MNTSTAGTHLEFHEDGPFRMCHGPARFSGRPRVQHKLCLVATDLAALEAALLELAALPDCFAVKLTRTPKDGMWLGRALMVEASVVGGAWRALRRHPHLLCTVQDDTFIEPFRDPEALALARERAAQAEARQKGS